MSYLKESREIKVFVSPNQNKNAEKSQTVGDLPVCASQLLLPSSKLETEAGVASWVRGQRLPHTC